VRVAEAKQRVLGELDEIVALAERETRAFEGAFL
jgi:hypothetical protein